MNRKIFHTSFLLLILFLLSSPSFFAQGETTFLTPKKNPKTVFVALDGKKAYVFEIFRIPDASGFTGRNVLDTLTETSTGMYEGRNTTLSIAGVPKNLFLKSLHEKKDVTIEMVANEGTNDPFNISLNNALLNQFAVNLSNEINAKYVNTDFFVGDIVNRFYSEEDEAMPYQKFESKYAAQYKEYADSTMKKHEQYNNKVNELRAQLLGITPEDFNKSMQQLPKRDDMSVSHFKTLTNELAMSNPLTYLKAAEIASPEVRKDMFEVLTSESRRNILANGPDCEMKTELKKQHHKKVWKDVALIGIPSALIVVGAATINTN